MQCDAVDLLGDGKLLKKVPALRYMLEGHHFWLFPKVCTPKASVSNMRKHAQVGEKI